ncbi:MAG: dihydroorotase [Phycisphaerae bacterium]|nr:dihydroorotase [Phycisphaerae bacterium]
MSTASILIKQGRLIDPARHLDEVGDLLLEGGKVRRIGGSIAEAAERTIDASGLIVCPGLIDVHTHLREPGHEEEETIASGTHAAVAGGFTSVACMPNTHPPLDNQAGMEFVTRQAARAGHCNVYPIGCITKGRQGKELAEMGQMIRAGAVAFSDDGDGVADAGVLQRAMQYSTMFDVPLIEHCENADLSSGGVMNGGATALRLGLPGASPMAEVIMLQRDLVLAEATGARYHAAHVSTAGAVELIRQAKRQGIRVTAEVTPHHLSLTENDCREYDPNFKMSPPLRTQADVEACLDGLADGTIDCLATDHAPHGQEEKELEFLYAPFGVIGLESALPIYVKALIESKVVGWPELVRLMTVNPARILNLPKGTLAPGADADVTLIDPDLVWTIDVEQFKSHSRNCPYHGWSVRGRAVATIVGGVVKHAGGALAQALSAVTH